MFKFIRPLVLALALLMPFQSVFAAYNQPPKAPFTIDIQVDDMAPVPSIYFQLQRCKDLIQQAYYALPEQHRQGLSRVKLVWSTTMGRGLGGGNEIILRCNNVGEKELVGVFVHEIGHVTDTGVLQGHAASGESNFRDNRIELFKDDKSLDFYKISWVNTKQKHKGSVTKDFVTTYAMTDPFEDFAETYTFYILHGRQFKLMTKQSTRLKSKYKFMKDEIFDGKEYINNYQKPNLGNRDYDSTVLSFSLENFLKRR